MPGHMSVCRCLLLPRNGFLFYGDWPDWQLLRPEMGWPKEAAQVGVIEPFVTIVLGLDGYLLFSKVGQVLLHTSIFH